MAQNPEKLVNITAAATAAHIALGTAISTRPGAHLDPLAPLLTPEILASEHQDQVRASLATGNHPGLSECQRVYLGSEHAETQIAAGTLTITAALAQALNVEAVRAAANDTHLSPLQQAHLNSAYVMQQIWRCELSTEDAIARTAPDAIARIAQNQLPLDRKRSHALLRLGASPEQATGSQAGIILELIQGPDFPRELGGSWWSRRPHQQVPAHEVLALRPYQQEAIYHWDKTLEQVQNPLFAVIMEKIFGDLNHISLVGHFGVASLFRRYTLEELAPLDELQMKALMDDLPSSHRALTLEEVKNPAISNFLKQIWGGDRSTFIPNLREFQEWLQEGLDLQSLVDTKLLEKIDFNGLRIHGSEVYILRRLLKQHTLEQLRTIVTTPLEPIQIAALMPYFLCGTLTLEQVQNPVILNFIRQVGIDGIQDVLRCLYKGMGIEQVMDAMSLTNTPVTALFSADAKAAVTNPGSIITTDLGNTNSVVDLSTSRASFSANTN